MQLKHFRINQCLGVILIIKISYYCIAFEEVNNIKSVLNVIPTIYCSLEFLKNP